MNPKSPTWLRVDVIDSLPVAVFSLPLRACFSLGLAGRLVDFGTNPSQGNTRGLAEKMEELVCELKPTLHNCTVAGLEINYMVNKLQVLVYHPLLPATKVTDPPTLIDLSKDVEQLLYKRSQGLPAS